MRVWYFKVGELVLAEVLNSDPAKRTFGAVDLSRDGNDVERHVFAPTGKAAEEWLQWFVEQALPHEWAVIDQHEYSFNPKDIVIRSVEL